MSDHSPTTPPPLTPTRATPRRATSVAAHVGPEPDEDDPLLAFEPYLHAAPRRNSITPPVQRKFVAALAATGLVSVAARTVGRSLEALYKLRHRPGAKGFAKAWDAALERGARRLEDMAFERALVGTRTPIVSGGQLLDWYDKPDNGLLRFLLIHRLPKRYGPEQEKPGEEIYRKALEMARQSAEAYIAEQQDVELDELVELLNHMVENALAGRAYISGVNLTGSLRDAAADLRTRKAAAAAEAAAEGAAEG